MRHHSWGGVSPGDNAEVHQMWHCVGSYANVARLTTHWSAQHAWHNAPATRIRHRSEVQSDMGTSGDIFWRGDVLMVQRRARDGAERSQLLPLGGVGTAREGESTWSLIWRTACSGRWGCRGGGADPPEPGWQEESVHTNTAPGYCAVRARRAAERGDGMLRNSFQRERGRKRRWVALGRVGSAA